jgi:glycosyltransferase involved in cell wall biosynthesis
MNINFISPINTLSYGYVGLNLLKALKSLGHNVALWTIGPGEAQMQDAPFIDGAVYNTKFYDVTAPCVRLWHQYDLSMYVGRGKHIGFPIFELDSFTGEEIYQLNSVDALCVCSDWAVDVLLDNHVKTPCYIVPLGVDRNIFSDTIETSPGHSTVFMNCGKWELRKGHDVLITAFNKAFEPNDDVKLVLHCANPFPNVDNKAWTITAMRSKLGREGKIYVSPNRLATQREIVRLFSVADCGVFPSRAEGWNLELLEFMSMGKQVIATNYSAHTQYCDKDNAMLIDIKELELAEDKVWFHGQGKWAYLGNEQVEQLINYMRQVHKSKQEGSLSKNVAGVETAKRFSWENSAENLIHASSN